MAKVKQSLTDAERRHRSVAMAREIDASEHPKDFERAFWQVAEPPSEQAPSQ